MQLEPKAVTCHLFNYTNWQLIQISCLVVVCLQAAIKLLFLSWRRSEHYDDTVRLTCGVVDMKFNHVIVSFCNHAKTFSPGVPEISCSQQRSPMRLWWPMTFDLWPPKSMPFILESLSYKNGMEVQPEYIMPRLSSAWRHKTTFAVLTSVFLETKLVAWM